MPSEEVRIAKRAKPDFHDGKPPQLLTPAGSSAGGSVVLIRDCAREP